MDEKKKALKQKYIPLCIKGVITEKECSEKIGITTRAVSNLKRRFRNEGYQCFEHKNKGKTSNKKITEKEEKLIIDLYLTKYKDFEFRKFCRILKTDYNISYSYTTIAVLLKKYNIQSPLIGKYNRLNNPDFSDYILLFHDLCDSLGYDRVSDYKNFLNQFDLNTIDKNRMYSSLFLCDCLYNVAFLNLKKILKTQKITIPRTSYSVFEYCINQKYFDISYEWNYWNEYHKYFSLSYDEEVRLNTIIEVYKIYFPMFYKIYLYFTKKNT
ncbi:MAG: helix-turn-helix domain-containing protein [Treponema sp.]|uniref:hypothetical protein n=1 Tax=Treponema sp. TaxID=166 RepID=UPI0025F94BE7|nr:hypothetical protein [Treponema sp.]MBQ9282376.1 helix-turn-helix domain-containing protein [Treponema sp.]